MLLVIDVGNTNITLGLYNGDQFGPRSACNCSACWLTTASICAA